MEMRLRAPVTRGYFFLLASLTRLRREISIRKKISSGTQGNKEGVLDQKENKLDSLSFPTKRKRRSDGYMLYVEMLVDFFASPGHRKCVRCISSLVTSQRVSVDECL